jgi:hypothetical protein
LAAAAGLCAVFLPPPVAGSRQPAGVKLLLAFGTVRDRRAPPYPAVHFYEHDGVAGGRLVGSIDPAVVGKDNVRGDFHPSLSRDGRWCAFSGQLGIVNGGRIEVWDRQEKKLLTFPLLNDEPKTHRMHPSLSGDGRLVAFTAYGWPGLSPRWDVLVYDTVARKLLPLPHLNSEKFDERMPAFSGNGRLLAYVSNAPGGRGGLDIYLYDLAAKKVIAVPEMNSPNLDIEPSLSADGRLIAFASDRPGGSGGRDVYLFDRAAGKFQPLPNLNSVAHDHSPSLSPDGRFLAFVSERIGGAGERDVYLYDRRAQKLLPTPGLNSKEDEIDPCVIVLGTSP